jgi:hypothetical protein
MDHSSRNHSIKEVTAKATRATTGEPPRRSEGRSPQASTWEELQEAHAQKICGGMIMVHVGFLITNGECQGLVVIPGPAGF